MNQSHPTIIGETNTQFIDGDRSARYPKREEYVDSGIMFLNGESINRGTINKEAVNFITEQKYRDIKKEELLEMIFFLQQEETVLAMRHLLRPTTKD